MTHLFISSTSKDLGDISDPAMNYRQAVANALRQAGFDVIAMEDFVAQSGDAMSVSEAELKRADAVIGIYAHRYGFVPPGQDHSVTEMEFDWALASEKPLFCFLFDEDAYIAEYGKPAFRMTPLFRKSDPEQIDALEAFHARILQRVVARFTTPDQLAQLVVSSLTRWLQHGKPADLSTLPPAAPTINVTQHVEKNDGIVIGNISGNGNQINQKR